MSRLGRVRPVVRKLTLGLGVPAPTAGARVPNAPVKSLIARLDRRLKGTRLPLERVVPFPGGFVFWTVDPDSPERPQLQAAHEEALTLAEGALDPTTNARIVEGTART